MKTIYKYPLEITDFQDIQTIEGAKPLCVKLQNEVPCLWCLVETDAKPDILTIRCAGTGHDMKVKRYSDVEYIDTVLMLRDSFVFHFFVVKP